MRTHEECYPCFLQQVVNTLEMMGVEPHKRCGILRGVMKTILRCPEDWSPPEVSAEVYGYIAEETGVKDPFREKKEESNRIAATMIPVLKEMIGKSDTPLLDAVKAAIAGNIIDFGVSHSFEIEDSKAILSLPLGVNHYPLFEEEIKESTTVLYLADNAGEIGFDSILIEQLVQMGKEVTVAVRSAPIINDATLEDARFFGIEKMAKLITSGSPAPGTPLSMVTSEFRAFFDQAHVVISKGQGNFETLDDAQRPIYFFLRAKCRVIAELLGVDLGSILLIKR